MLWRSHRCLVLGAFALGGVSCFVGDAARGLPCEEARDCGIRLACIDGFCGGIEEDPGTTDDGGTTSTAETTGTTGSPTCAEIDDAQCDPVEEPDRCTPECRFAECGDGYFHPAVEECDHTAGAPESDAGECTRECYRTFFWDDMQDGGDKWTLDPTSDGWRIEQGQWRSGRYRGSAGVVALRTQGGVELPEEVPEGTRLELRFRHAYAFDTCPTPAETEPDGGLIRVWADDPVDVAPEGGYPGLLDPTSICLPNLAANPIAGSEAFIAMQREADVVVDLSAFLGQTIDVELVLGYDCGNCGIPDDDAWWIDDVVIAPFVR